MTDALINAAEQIDSLRAENDKLASDYDSAREQSDRYLTEICSLRTCLLDRCKDRDRLKSSNIAYRTEYDRMQAELAAERRENDKLRKYDSENKHLIHTLRKRCESLVHEMEGLRAELAALNETRGLGKEARRE